MIINVKKYLLIGAKEEIDRFFSRAQTQGVIEFISPSGKKVVELPAEVQTLSHAIKILRKLPVKKPYEGDIERATALEVADRVLELKAEVEKLSEEKRLVEAEISRVAPFGDFSTEDIDFIEKESGREIQFFCMKTAKSHATNFTDEVIYIGTDYDLDYFVTINRSPKSYPDMIEMRIDRPLGELQTHLTFVKESLHQMEAELKGFAGHIDYLHHVLIDFLNDYHLHIAKKDLAFPLEGTLFAVEAWVPENKTNILFAVIDGMAVHCEPIVIEEQDKVPTYMENKGAQRIGEDLVKIYDIPATSDKDPSGWVFWFFALFFAMIVADGGYGLLYLGIALYLKFKYPSLKGQGKRFVKLALILSTACVLWGVATSAFFGIQVQPKSWLGKVSLIQYLAVKKAEYHLNIKDDVQKQWVAKFSNLTNVKNGQEFLDGAVSEEKGRISYEMFDAFSDSILLEFSLIIGVIHIAFSFLRYLFRHWAGIGWIAFMVGCYLYFPETLNATSLLHFLGFVDKQTGNELGLQLIYSGVIAALFLALVQKRLKGLGEIANMVQVFADVLSYLRLYALGLAGSIMASTFNEIGQDVGLFIGWIVILFGHSVNILLGLMAGVIHGLRLNFIEWYHYCFDGGGRLFNPLMRMKPKEH
ncbi:MAG: V-type ATP synthase subunit I [Parachlamydiales bacterium]|nr:V-type ATP synthase subunit I [Verrucomicrobiota bacterium]MBX3719762.1 V-type ATP synthase subunit I [Candidatus Acheromyda pituitae]